MSKRLYILVITVILLLVATSGISASPFQCGGDWKNDSGGSYSGTQTITSVWVKAGQGCYELPDACYEVTGGGVGYTWVEVVDVPGAGCQDMSHLEGTFEEITPTSTMTQIPTNTATTTPQIPTNTPQFTETATPTNMPTDTPEPTETPTAEPTNTPEPTENPKETPTPYPTKECQLDSCNGLG